MFFRQSQASTCRWCRRLLKEASEGELCPSCSKKIATEVARRRAAIQAGITALGAADRLEAIVAAGDNVAEHCRALLPYEEAGLYRLEPGIARTLEVVRARTMEMVGAMLLEVHNYTVERLRSSLSLSDRMGEVAHLSGLITRYSRYLNDEAVWSLTQEAEALHDSLILEYHLELAQHEEEQGSPRQALNNYIEAFRVQYRSFGEAGGQRRLAWIGRKIAELGGTLPIL